MVEGVGPAAAVCRWEKQLEMAGVLGYIVTGLGWGMLQSLVVGTAEPSKPSFRPPLKSEGAKRFWAGQQRHAEDWARWSMETPLFLVNGDVRIVLTLIAVAGCVDECVYG